MTPIQTFTTGIIGCLGIRIIFTQHSRQVLPSFSIGLGELSAETARKNGLLTKGRRENEKLTWNLLFALIECCFDKSKDNSIDLPKNW